MHGQTFEEASARESPMRPEHVDDIGEAHYRSLNEGAGCTEVAQERRMVPCCDRGEPSPVQTPD